ncbi:Os08g0156066, partial [Oryza sativa Japonica Group]
VDLLASLAISNLVTLHRRRSPRPCSSSSCSRRRRRRRRRASCGRPPRIAWRRRRRGRRVPGGWGPCNSAPRTRRRPCQPGTGTADAASKTSSPSLDRRR